jgi:hypothetical protein
MAQVDSVVNAPTETTALLPEETSKLVESPTTAGDSPELSASRSLPLSRKVVILAGTQCAVLLGAIDMRVFISVFCLALTVRQQERYGRLALVSGFDIPSFARVELAGDELPLGEPQLHSNLRTVDSHHWKKGSERYGHFPLLDRNLGLRFGSDDAMAHFGTLHWYACSLCLWLDLTDV